MQFQTGEHNYLRRSQAESTAAELGCLFSGTAPVPAMPKGEQSGSIPPLIDNLEDAPALKIIFPQKKYEILAIDGGSSVLAKGGNIEVIAWRAGCVSFDDINRVDEKCPPPEILAYNRLTVQDILSDYLADTDVTIVSQEQPIRLVDELRWLEEWKLLSRLIENSRPQSLILIDGSLHLNPLYNADSQHGLFKNAAEKKVYLAAVTKTSSLSIDRTTPIDIGIKNNTELNNSIWYKKINQKLKADSLWLGDIYLARLHSGADKQYRVDLNRFDEDNTDEIMGMIASVSDDVEFAGYPYPLAAAHRLARIDSIFKQDMLNSLKIALDNSDFSLELWQYLTRDIHDKLNADIMELTHNDQ
ncbi:MAG: DNA double-strand break repair nuclease NurA [candidate division Zixibacteria bacterium]|nr:DNA double-strand break repair nuclease NurA [candidate division Zixibacteria bacterium]